MPTLPPGIPDWRDAGAYAPLLEVERAGLAWEWLRRNPAYREAAGGAGGPARERPCLRKAESRATAWGLHAFEDPALDAVLARPVWSAERLSLVLSASAEPSAREEDRFDIERFGDLALLVKADDAEHLLISDGARSVRLDIVSGSLSEGPVSLHYQLGGLASAHAPLLVLRRLLALWRRGRFSGALFPRERRAGRIVLALRAADAVAAGAGQRRIAAELLDDRAGRIGWRVDVPSVRSRTQRLVHLSRRMTEVGYLKLLKDA